MISIDELSSSNPEPPVQTHTITPKTAEELEREYEEQRQSLLQLKARLAQNQIEVLNN